MSGCQVGTQVLGKETKGPGLENQYLQPSWNSDVSGRREGGTEEPRLARPGNRRRQGRKDLWEVVEEKGIEEEKWVQETWGGVRNR